MPLPKMPTHPFLQGPCVTEGLGQAWSLENRGPIVCLKPAGIREARETMVVLALSKPEGPSVIRPNILEARQQQ